MKTKFKKFLKGISQSAEKMVKEIERQELAKTIIPKEEEEKGFLEKLIIKHDTVDGEREIINLPDSACLVPVTTDGFYIFSSQYRASRKAVSTSVYGGYVDEGETPLDTAIREMYEECNITDDKTEKFECIYFEKFPSAGISTEKNSLYLMHLNCTKDELDVKSNDKGETVEPVFVTKEQVKELELDGLKAWVAQQYIKNIK